MVIDCAKSKSGPALGLGVIALVASLSMAPEKAPAATVVPLVPFNVTGPTDFEGQVTVDVYMGQASFTFATTAGNSNTSIARIYFEMGLGEVLSGTPTLTFTPIGSMDFAAGTGNPGPNEPPSGNEVPNGPWAGTFERFKADVPPPEVGINVGESLTITYAYAGSESALVASILDLSGKSRLSAQVLNCDGQDGCVVSAVPVPAAVWLFASGLLGIIAVGRRRKAA